MVRRGMAAEETAKATADARVAGEDMARAQAPAVRELTRPITAVAKTEKTPEQQRQAAELAAVAGKPSGSPVEAGVNEGVSETGAGAEGAPGAAVAPAPAKPEADVEELESGKPVSAAQAKALMDEADDIVPEEKAAVIEKAVQDTPVEGAADVDGAVVASKRIKEPSSEKWKFTVGGRTEPRVTVTSVAQKVIDSDIAAGRTPRSLEQEKAAASIALLDRVSELPSLPHFNEEIEKIYSPEGVEHDTIQHYHLHGDELAFLYAYKDQDGKQRALVGKADIPNFGSFNDTPGVGHDWTNALNRQYQTILHETLAADPAMRKAKTPEEKAAAFRDTLVNLKRNLGKVTVVLPLKGEPEVNLGLNIGIGEDAATAEKTLTEVAETVGRNSIGVDKTVNTKYNISGDKGTDLTQQYYEAGLRSTKLEARYEALKKAGLLVQRSPVGEPGRGAGAGGTGVAAEGRAEDEGRVEEDDPDQLERQAEESANRADELRTRAKKLREERSTAKPADEKKPKAKPAAEEKKDAGTKEKLDGQQPRSDEDRKLLSRRRKAGGDVHPDEAEDRATLGKLRDRGAGYVYAARPAEEGVEEAEFIAKSAGCRLSWFADTSYATVTDGFVYPGKRDVIFLNVFANPDVGYAGTVRHEIFHLQCRANPAVTDETIGVATEQLSAAGKRRLGEIESLYKDDYRDNKSYYVEEMLSETAADNSVKYWKDTNQVLAAIANVMAAKPAEAAPASKAPDVKSNESWSNNVIDKDNTDLRYAIRPAYLPRVGSEGEMAWMAGLPADAVETARVLYTIAEDSVAKFGKGKNNNVTKFLTTGELNAAVKEQPELRKFLKSILRTLPEGTALVTSNPQLVRGNLGCWIVKRVGHGSHGRTDSRINRGLLKSASRGRLTVSFEYIPKKIKGDNSWTR